MSLLDYLSDFAGLLEIAFGLSMLSFVDRLLSILVATSPEDKKTKKSVWDYDLDEVVGVQKKQLRESTDSLSTLAAQSEDGL